MATTAAVTRVPLPRQTAFRADLDREIDKHFRKRGITKYAGQSMHRKSAVLPFVWLVLYITIVYFTHSWIVALLLGFLIATCKAGMGMVNQHDGGHKAYSKSKAVNNILAFNLDLLGGSSYFWFWKHHVWHHSRTNELGADADIDTGGLVVLSPQTERKPMHRFQHFYTWPLYGLLAIKWHHVDDWKHWIKGKIGHNPIPRPKNWKAVAVVVGKTFFYLTTFILPLTRHPWYVVIPFYLYVAVIMGIELSCVFQLAHCVLQAAHPRPDGTIPGVPNDWSLHQLATSIGFCQSRPMYFGIAKHVRRIFRHGRFNYRHARKLERRLVRRAITWFLGGLNYQDLHHVRPDIAHEHYPELAHVFDRVCRKHGFRRFVHPTVWSALKSHYQFLKLLGNGQSLQPLNVAP